MKFIEKHLKMGKYLAVSMVAIAVLFSGIMPSSLRSAFAAEKDDNVTIVTPNPWYYHDDFEGWGTSLAWLANATGSYGEQGSIKTSSGDAAADKQALAYGKQLREDFYKAIFSSDGLNLNMARYNIGGGNASDVAYGYPFMRQGAAVPGYWADDIDGSAGIYGKDVDGHAITSRQSDKTKLDKAFDPTKDAHYDWSKGASQEWWLKHGIETGDIDQVETFANSAPWFMTTSGYVMGGTDSNANNLSDPEKFAQYLVTVTNYLERKYNFTVSTIEGMNESETNYWGAPSKRATLDLSNPDKSGMTRELLNYYWTKYYADKDKGVTPYSKDVKKPQEGMHIDNAQQQKLILALKQALAASGNDHTRIAATDATDSGHLVDSYNKYSQDVKNSVEQLNTHSYGTTNQRVVRDIAQGSATKLSMSEVDGSWQSGGFDPFNANFSNGLGMAGKINSDVYALQSKDFTFWQVVEDLYNMSTGSSDINGNVAKIKGENTNWGTVLIDFDCTVAGKDGKLYSERTWLNNGKSTQGIAPCTVLANSKYNAVRAYTKFIHKGDKVITNSSTADNFTATSKDGKTQTLIHRNTSDHTQTLVIDLSRYGNIAQNASGTAYLTTAPRALDSQLGATISYLNKFSNIKQPSNAVVIDAKNKTATVTIPAKSIMSIQLSGISGAAQEAAAVHDNEFYQIIGKQSGLAVSRIAQGDSALSLSQPAAESASAKNQIWKFTPADATSAVRSSLRVYKLSAPDGRVLVQRGETNALADPDSAEARSSAAHWILNTENGSEWQIVNALVNSHARQALDVDGSKSSPGTKVGLWLSSAADNQTFTFRSIKPIGTKSVSLQTAQGVVPKSLVHTITPQYSWGYGNPAHVTWDSASIARDVQQQGTYTINGTAINEFGIEFPVHATLYVGDFTVVDPTSVTVLPHTSMSVLVGEVSRRPIYAHVRASEPIEIARDKVNWNYAGVEAKLASAKSGDVIVVSGYVELNGQKLTTQLRVYVMDAIPVNVADTQTNVSVNVQQQQYGKALNWNKLTDGDTHTEAWVTWGETTPEARTPEALIDFGDQSREVFSASITYLDQTPASVYAQYTSDGVTWLPFGTQINAPTGKVTFQSSDRTPVQARQIRIVNSAPDGTFMNASEIEVLATPTVSSPHNIASTAGTHFSVNVQEGDTGSKAIDGDVTAKGWSTWGTSSAENPVATFTFDQPQNITEVKTIFYRDGRASWPKSQTLEYQDENDQWKTVGSKDGWYVQPHADEDSSTDVDTPTVSFQLSHPVTAKAVRITNVLQDTGVYINVAEIQVFSRGGLAHPRQASDASLADLRVDGQTIHGFDSTVKDYTLTVPAGKGIPVIQAFAADAVARVKVENSAFSDDSIVAAVVRVTSADGKKNETYTVRILTPSVQLNKSTVRRGEKIHTTVTHLIPGKKYSLWLHSTPQHLMDVTSDDTGTAQVGITVPAGAQVGNHSVALTANGGMTVLAQAYLSIIEETQVTPIMQNSSSKPGAYQETKRQNTKNLSKNSKNSDRVLSSTGAQVSGVLGIALCALAVGGVLSVRRLRKHVRD
ncbi:discoidin domain-containing protein [Alloscardovia venturai]|uniref:Discoidin domain-containing protein n=1 Tax=Alloscardovia venturai TaxID=1769421 RepID=A0ABW2Y8T0_9BIFI